MEIFIERENKSMKKKFEGSAGDLLSKLKLNPVTVLVVRNNVLVTEKAKLKDSDSVKILSVVSGG